MCSPVNPAGIAVPLGDRPAKVLLGRGAYAFTPGVRRLARADEVVEAEAAAGVGAVADGAGAVADEQKPHACAISATAFTKVLPFGRSCRSKAPCDQRRSASGSPGGLLGEASVERAAFEQGAPKAGEQEVCAHAVARVPGKAGARSRQVSSRSWRRRGRASACRRCPVQLE